MSATDTFYKEVNTKRDAERIRDTEILNAIIGKKVSKILCDTSSLDTEISEIVFDDGSRIILRGELGPCVLHSYLGF